MISAALKRTAARSARRGVAPGGQSAARGGDGRLAPRPRPRSSTVPTTSSGRPGLTDVQAVAASRPPGRRSSSGVRAGRAASAHGARAPRRSASRFSARREVGVRLVGERRRRARRRSARSAGAAAAAARTRPTRPGGATSASTAAPSTKVWRRNAVVGRVLEQAAHEVGHAGDQLADRRVLAQAQAQVAHRRLDRVAHAVQHLDLEGVLGQAERLRASRSRRASERTLWLANAGRICCGCSSMMRARRSYIASLSGLCVNTGTGQPSWAASTVS